MSPDPSWVDKLKPLVERDQFVRDALVSRGILEDAYHHEMEKVHLENTLKLKKLIQRMGFPVISNAGDEGVRLSWLIIHHSISNPDFMKESLIEMRMAAAQNDYPLELLAHTDDRIAFFEGRPQLYGTNFDWLAGSQSPTPIADPQFVDERRKSLGLPPIAESLFKFGHMRPPKDPEKKVREFEIWRKKVGWRI
jgi:hypothetical protein